MPSNPKKGNLSLKIDQNLPFGIFKFKMLKQHTLEPKAYGHSVAWNPIPNHNQSEPAATNALIGHFVHWMGRAFSFDTKWGSSQSIFFVANHCIFFFGCWPFFPWT
jgi:hypothetical protein